MTPSANLRATRRTVVIAGGANLAVAALKLAAGLVAGLSAMLAESAHSLPDTLNQGLLLVSLRLPVVPHVFVDPTHRSSPTFTPEDRGR
jgi:divalent metal cation (Fe/Co/Zn/Cd) transporter